MPSFKLLPEDEIRALIDYVKYLSIRGQVERDLLTQELDQLMTQEGFDPFVNRDESSEDFEPIEDQLAYYLDEYYFPILESWLDAEDSVTSVSEAPEDLSTNKQLASKGKELFLGKANCGQMPWHDRVGRRTNRQLRPVDHQLVGNSRRRSTGSIHLSILFGCGCLSAANHEAAKFAVASFPWRQSTAGYLPAHSQWDRWYPHAAGSALSPEEIWALVAYMLQLPDDSLSQSPGSGETP